VARAAGDGRVGNRPVLRAIAVVLSVATLGAATEGCGSTGNDATVALVPSAPATAAQASAHAINLRAGDLPGMSAVTPEEAAPAPTSTAIEFADCYGGVNPLRRVSDVRSPEFAEGQGAHSTLLQSEVEVLSSASVAAANNSAVRSSRADACFEKFLNRINRRRNKERTGQLSYGPVSVSSLPNPLPSAQGGFARRIVTTTYRQGHLRVRIYKDVLGFLDGPAEITLVATAFSRPVPSARERRLLALLQSRAEKF
jgi:hypothetical protein